MKKELPGTGSIALTVSIEHVTHVSYLFLMRRCYNVDCCYSVDSCYNVDCCYTIDETKSLIIELLGW